MTTLHLGVVDVPYVKNEPVRSRNKRLKRQEHPSGEHVTTGDVADILEDEYHPMEVFFELHGQDIADRMAASIDGAMENLLIAGGPVTADVFGDLTSGIEDDFKAFLTNKEMDALGYPGVPTQASLKGVNHRLKHPYAKRNKSRPSFVDTGLYQASFKAWVD